LIWQDQPLFASKFVSGGWDYFNNGGSLVIPAPQFVSGGWDNRNMNPERDKAYAELKSVFEDYFKIFKGRLWIKVLYVIGLSFYVGGYVFNNLQNNNQLFSLAWFVDAALLSWTNLLILPVLFTVIPWNKVNRNWSLFKEHCGYHFYSPAFWILGYIFLKFCVKVLEFFGTFISSVLNWLGS
jgi:hypothetical protein